jgi:hypothetical protein
VGKADYSVVVPMHPEQGYVSLASPLFFVFVSGFFFFLSQSYILIPSLGDPGLPDRPTPDPRGRGGRGEEAKER